MTQHTGTGERTAELRAAQAEAEKGVRGALRVARTRLEASGVTRAPEQGAFCFECSCPQFLPRDPLDLDLGGGDHDPSPCRRGVCGHGFLKHYIY